MTVSPCVNVSKHYKTQTTLNCEHNCKIYFVQSVNESFQNERASAAKEWMKNFPVKKIVTCLTNTNVKVVENNNGINLPFVG